MGVLHGGTWRRLRVPDRRLRWQGHPWHHGWPCLTRNTLKVVLISLLEVGQEGWFFMGVLGEDIEGSWQDAWMTGSSMMSWITLFDPKENTLKASCYIFIISVSRRTLRVPDRRLGWQSHQWGHGWPCVTPRKTPWKFCVDIFYYKCVKNGGT